MTHLTIQASRPYSVYVEAEAILHIREIKQAQEADQFWIITDQTVADLHMVSIRRQLEICFPVTPQCVSTVEPGA